MDLQEFTLKAALAEALRAAEKLKAAHGQSPQGRRCAIVATEIEKVQALQAAWDPVAALPRSPPSHGGGWAPPVSTSRLPGGKKGKGRKNP